MASETPSGQAGLSQHPFVEKLMPDPAQPATRTIQFEGLVGKSTRGEDYWRLYFDRELSDYIEFHKDDVLNTETIAKEHSPMGLESTRVWLKRDATITRTHSLQVQAADAAPEAAYTRYVSPPVPMAAPAPLGDPYGGRKQLGAFPQGGVVSDAQRRHTVPDFNGKWAGEATVTESTGGPAPGIGRKDDIAMTIIQWSDVDPYDPTVYPAIARLFIKQAHFGRYGPYVSWPGDPWPHNIGIVQDVIETDAAANIPCSIYRAFVDTDVLFYLDFWSHSCNSTTDQHDLGVTRHWRVDKASATNLRVSYHAWNPAGYFNWRAEASLDLC
jgi:hypothetical protein